MSRLFKLLGATGKMPQPARELGLAVLFTALGFIGGFPLGFWSGFTLHG